MLVQALLEIQGRYGYLPEAELEFLALRAGVPLYRVQEVTTFFPHFRREAPPRVTLSICQSMSCHLRGAPELLREARELEKRHGRDNLEVCAVSCLGRCDRAPAALLGQHTHHGNGTGHHELLFTGLGNRHSLPRLVETALAGGDLKPDHDRLTDDAPNWQINVYHPGQGAAAPEPYSAAKQLVANLDRDEKQARDDIIAAVKSAGLVGMGGAAARTFNKWDEVRRAKGETKYIICNADESEPGTFKDRELMLRAPHLLVEGMLIAGLTVGACKGYIYTRHEYPEQIEACNQEIKRARALIPEAFARCPIETFTSPGLYICGEESALIEVIEGKRAQPRNQPPTIRENGLFDKPTVVNNVETYMWVPAILLRQPKDWYKDEPLRFFSISGDVRSPGVFEVPFGMTLSGLIKLAGGMREGLGFYAAAMSGPSGGFQPARLGPERTQKLIKTLDDKLARSQDLGGYDTNKGVWKWRQSLKDHQLQELTLLDLPLNVNAFRAMDLSLGAAIIIYGTKKGERPDMLEHARNCLDFFHKESCGKCVPCRLGAGQLAHLAREVHTGRVPLAQVQDTVRAVAGVMKVASICGLGRAASVPFTTWLDNFAAKSPFGASS